MCFHGAVKYHSEVLEKLFVLTYDFSPGQLRLVLEDPGVPALCHCPKGVGTDHSGDQFGLALVRGQHVDCPVEAALSTLDFNTWHRGVKDIGQF